MDKTFRTTNVEFKNVPSLELEDLTQECYAYMKTKQFMAQRIFEQQEEIETLKSQLFYHSIKHVQMYNWLKHINDQVHSIKVKRDFQNKEELNLSEDLANSFVYEQQEKTDTEFEKKKMFSRNPSNNNLKETNELDNLNKIINNLKNENLELKKENETLRVENLDKNLIITKLKSEKFLIYNELIELVNTLKTVDIKLLNKFYKNLSSNSQLSKNYMPSSLGIKYNILSVQNQLSYLMHSDLVSAKGYQDYLTKAKDTFSKAREEEDVDNNILKNEEVNLKEEQENIIDLDKYILVVKKFEKEFENICDKNMRKSNLKNDY